MSLTTGAKNKYERKIIEMCLQDENVYSYGNFSSSSSFKKIFLFLDNKNSSCKWKKSYASLSINSHAHALMKRNSHNSNNFIFSFILMITCDNKSYNILFMSS